MTLVNKLTFLFLFANVAFALWVGFLLFFPVQIDIIHNEPFPVSPTVVKKGEAISWWVEFSKHNSYPTTIHRNIICDDGNLVTLAGSETNAPQGDKLVARGGVAVPEKASIGTCHVELQATYHINPLRDIQRTYRTQDFLVIE